MNVEHELCVRVESRAGSPVEHRFMAAQYVLVGRESSCDLVLRSSSVSRKHLELRLGDAGIEVKDTSANGTRLNGQLLCKESQLVASGFAELLVGRYRLQVARQCASHSVNQLDGKEREADPRECHAHAGKSASSAQERDASANKRPSARTRQAAQEPGPRQPSARDAGVRRRAQALLFETLDLRNRKLGSRPDPSLRNEVLQALKTIVASPELGIAAAQRPQLVRELADEALGLGPLEGLLGDSSVSEIMVVDPETIYVERAGRLELSAASFTDAAAVLAVIERIVTPLGRRIDESSPLVDARLADGSRVNAVIPPLALRGPCLTIRKFPERRLSAQELTDYGTWSTAMCRLLEASVRLRKNVVVSGGTGSGKTTLLNVLSSFIDPAERIVTIEDAAELQLQQPHVVGLESKPPNLEGRGEIAIRDLVKNALRMRPDRIVVGECRGGEVVDMLQAMNTGHEGSMTTTHANSPKEAVTRLETLGLLAGLGLPVSAIRRQVADSVDLIVQQARLADGRRRVTSISELVGLSEAGDVELREIFRLEGDWHRPTGNLPSFVHELVAASSEAGANLEMFR